MKLSEAEKNINYRIKAINEKDDVLRLRLIQLGIFEGAIISVLRYSPKKQTMLINIFNTAFALKTNVAKNIEIG